MCWQQIYEFIKNSVCYRTFVGIFSIYSFQFKVSSIMTPRKFNLLTLSITVPSILSTEIFKALLIILYSMYFDLFTLRDHLFLTFHLFWLIHYLLGYLHSLP